MPAAPTLIDLNLPTGLRLHAASQGPPSGRPIVLLPAYVDSWVSYRLVLAALPAWVRALAIDLRGHGRSDKPSCCYLVEDFAKDVAAALDSLAITGAILVGHSGSCLVARAVAASRPDLVAHLVLLSSPLVLDRQRLRPFREAVAQLRDPVPAAFIRELQGGAAHRPLPPEFLDELVLESSRVPAKVWKAALEGLLQFDDTDVLPELTVPATLLWGEADQIVDRASQLELAGLLPQATLLIYPDTGHSPQWEVPEQVAADLGRLVAS